MTELRSGTFVTPTLRLLRPLGEGGMGRVWVAEHLTLDTKVVVKFMAKEIAENADGVARFAREASVAAQVKSPHVVQVFDHGITPDGDAYIVMELLEGRDLAAHLAANGKMAPPDVAALVGQVAKALGKAHQVGVVHRDIKPDNIFLCDAEGGELFVKLLDFGIAKREQVVSGAATTTGQVVGTPYYMSPEQIVGERDIDARTDIWSLGVVAFETLTGQRPFQGTTVGAITLAIHTGTRRISDHLPDSPATLDAWFAKACARDPKARFQSARDAAQALAEAVGTSEPTAGRLRSPMLSLVGDGSDPELAPASRRGERSDPPSGGRAVTHLSSAFPAPRPSRGRPAVVVGVLGVLLLLGGAVFALPALLRPRAKPTVAASFEDSPLPVTASVATAAPSASSSTGVAIAVPTGELTPAASSSASTALAASARTPVGPRGTMPVTTATGARTTVRSPPVPARSGRPRTRDDDDIK